MSNKQFISNLSSTYANVRKLDVKKINLKGKNIEDLWGLNLPEDYKKFVTRCELPEDENWAIWDDTGNLLYINFSDKIVDGNNLFYKCSNLSSFPYNLSSLTIGERMFYGCSNLRTFDSDLSSLTNGREMFTSCSNLTTFDFDLSALTDGYQMFYGCSKLTTFDSDLSSLNSGSYMFYGCSNLTSFTSPLSSLISCNNMFQNCSSLTSFDVDLSTIKYCGSMFKGCSNLRTFTSDLSSITEGNYLFEGCKLDSNSIENILTTIPSLTTAKKLTIGIQESAASKFAEITGLTPTTTQQTVSYKGWNVQVKINN